MHNLKHKVAVVTGAASGIGYAIALDLAKKGAQLVLADLNEADGRALAAETGGLFVATDLSDSSQCKNLISEAIAKFGSVDILVNNAGFQKVSPISEFPEESWNKMIAVLLTAPFLLSKAVWPAMKKRQWGRIINVASVHGLVASPFKSAYVSAKHGLLGFTKAAALEGGPDGITVNAICPAYVRTPLIEAQISDQAKNLGISPEKVIEEVMLAPAAIKKLIEPQEVADLVAYLCTDSARLVTGASWTLDAGWTSR